MLKDIERYILTTGKAPVIRDVLSLVFAAVKSEGEAIPDHSPGMETFAKTGCDRMILELRRPKDRPAAISPRIRNLRVSRLGRVLVVTGEATAPGILREFEALRRQRFFPAHLASDLAAPIRTLFRTLRPVHPHN